MTIAGRQRAHAKSEAEIRADERERLERKASAMHLAAPEADMSWAKVATWLRNQNDGGE